MASLQEKRRKNYSKRGHLNILDSNLVYSLLIKTNYSLFFLLFIKNRITHYFLKSHYSLIIQLFALYSLFIIK